MGRCGGSAQRDPDGCPDGFDGFDGFARETPEHEARIAGFELDTFEITVGRFRKFVEAYDVLRTSGWPYEGMEAHPLIEGSGWHTDWGALLPVDEADFRSDLPLREGDNFAGIALRCDCTNTWTDIPGSGEQYPINCVNGYESSAFCNWDGGRLPTEAEWEYAAARGSENRFYPWGDMDLLDRANYKNTAATSMLEVGSYPLGAARWGQHDLAGSLQEWVLDVYDENHYSGEGSECINCACLDIDSTSRVVRGGCYDEDHGGSSSNLRAAYRRSHGPYGHFHRVGFRCARGR